MIEMLGISKSSILTSIILWICFYKNYSVNLESCHGATVQNGTNGCIVDSNNNIWRIDSNDKIVLNGNIRNDTEYVILLVYWNGTIYQENRYKGWWNWTNNGWIEINDTQLVSSLASATGCEPSSPSDRDSTSASSQTVTTPETTTTSQTTSPDRTTMTSETTTAFQTTRTNEITTIKDSSLTTIIDKPPLTYFVPPICNDTNYIGVSCNISMKPCDVHKPCRNLGSCINQPKLLHGYSCICKSGFTGTDCQSDIRLCQSNTCLNNGVCKVLNNSNFYCNCTRGRTGVRCERLVDYCLNITCLNKGICRPLFLDYKCECLFGSSGHHCENVATSLLIQQYVSKGFAYIAIIALVATGGFIIVLDILKYVFGIDPVHEERERIRRKRVLLKRNKP